jgi:hypothetical protein
MKQYATIRWDEKKPEEVCDFLFNELAENEQYNFFSWLMRHFPNLKIDWLDIFENFHDELFEKDDIASVVTFVEWYKMKNLDEYKERFEYIEYDLCHHYLYKKDIVGLQQRVAFIQQYPVAAMDTLTTRLLYLLIFNGHYQLAVSYAEAVWQPISEADELMDFASFPFINTIVANEFQLYYEAWQKDTPLDETALFSKLSIMGYKADKEEFTNVINTLKEEINITTIQESVRSRNKKHMAILNIHFLKYMLHTHQLPFIFSEWMWNFIATPQLFGKQKGHENWFYVNTKTLDKHIRENFDNVWDFNDVEMFGKVWGLEYVFDFLHKNGLLSEEQHSTMQENISYFRGDIMQSAHNELWQMLFVLDWPRLNNNPNTEREESLFRATYNVNARITHELVKKHLSAYKIPARIKKELNITAFKIQHETPFWEAEEMDVENDDETDCWDEDKMDGGGDDDMPFYTGDTTHFFTQNTPFVKPEPDIGRNDQCPCGSGKKYKKCCLSK